MRIFYEKDDDDDVDVDVVDDIITSVHCCSCLRLHHRSSLLPFTWLQCFLLLLSAYLFFNIFLNKSQFWHLFKTNSFPISIKSIADASLYPGVGY